MRPLIAVPATCLLIARAWKKNSLTPAGLVAATITAVAHAYHPWNLPFVLLCVFFLAGTRVTHVKENVKASLTLASKGSSAGEGPRTHVQVFANSLMASVFSILHARQLRARADAFADPDASIPQGTLCYSWGGDLLIVGIIANYAAVAADTFSSELGILSKGSPRLVTSPTLRKVPRGTNGGVTLTGLAAGLFGSMVIVTASVLFLPACSEHTTATRGGGLPWTMEERRKGMLFMIIWGALGSLLDSFLGGLLQRSVRDVRSGKIVEGEGGGRALVSSTGSGGAVDARAKAKSTALEAEHKETVKRNSQSTIDDSADLPRSRSKPDADKQRKPSFGDERPSRVIESGWDVLDNNDVNFIMAAIMSVGGMAVASWYWGVPIQDAMKL